MNKTIYWISTDICSGQDFFLDESDGVICWWSNDDAQYRPEYMNGLFEHLNCRVFPVKTMTMQQYGAIRKVLLESGFSEENLSYLGK